MEAVVRLVDIQVHQAADLPVRGLHQPEALEVLNADAPQGRLEITGADGACQQQQLDEHGQTTIGRRRRLRRGLEAAEDSKRGDRLIAGQGLCGLRPQQLGDPLGAEASVLESQPQAGQQRGVIRCLLYTSDAADE